MSSAERQSADIVSPKCFRSALRDRDDRDRDRREEHGRGRALAGEDRRLAGYESGRDRERDRGGKRDGGRPRLRCRGGADHNGIRGSLFRAVHADPRARVLRRAHLRRAGTLPDARLATTADEAQAMDLAPTPSSWWHWLGSARDHRGCGFHSRRHLGAAATAQRAGKHHPGTRDARHIRTPASLRRCCEHGSHATRDLRDPCAGSLTSTSARIVRGSHQLQRIRNQIWRR